MQHTFSTDYIKIHPNNTKMAHGFPAKIYKKFWAVFVLFGEIFIFFEGKKSGGNFEIFQAILFF
jgi:hypothetical protein